MLTTLMLFTALQAPPQAVPAAEPAPQTVLRVHSLAKLLLPERELPSLVATPMIPDGAERGAWLDNSGLGAASADLVVSLLRGGVGDRDVELSLTGKSLLVSGSADGVGRVDRTLRYLEQSLAPRVQLRAALYRAAGGDLPRDDAGWTEYVRALGAPAWVATGSAPSGTRILLERGARIPFVRDFEVEVAQKADVEDPIVATFFDGAQVAVEPHALASGDVMVIAQFAVSHQRGAMSRRSPGGDGRIAMDVPTLAVTAGTLSGRAAPGRALVFVAQGRRQDGDDVVLTIEIESVGAVPEPVDGLGALPVSALLTRSLRSLPVSPESHFVTLHDAAPAHAATVEGEAFMTRPALTDLLTAAAVVPGADRAVSIDVVGSAAVLLGTREQLARARAVLTELERTLLVNVRPVLTTAVAGGAGADRAAVVHRVALPSLVGHRHTVARGIETTVIRDFDVEIAQNRAVSNPITLTVFRGMAASVGVLDGTDGRAADVIAVIGAHGDVHRRPSEGREIGDFWLVDAEIARLSWLGPVPDGGAVLGDAVHVAATEDVDGAKVPTVQRVEIR